MDSGPTTEEAQAIGAVHLALARLQKMGCDQTVVVPHLAFLVMVDKRGILLRGEQAPAVARLMEDELRPFRVEVDPRPDGERVAGPWWEGWWWYDASTGA